MRAVNGTWHRAEDVITNPYYDPGETYPGNNPETYEDWYQGRNYGLFSVLAGVRGYGPPIIEPRGLPDDIGESVKEEWGDGIDWHTPHWYTLDELEANIDRFKDPEYYCQDFVKTIDRMRKVADEELEGDGTKVRVVMWFDN